MLCVPTLLPQWRLPFLAVQLRQVGGCESNRRTAGIMQKCLLRQLIKRLCWKIKCLQFSGADFKLLFFPYKYLLKLQVKCDGLEETLPHSSHKRGNASSKVRLATYRRGIPSSLSQYRMPLRVPAVKCMHLLKIKEICLKNSDMKCVQI